MTRNLKRKTFVPRAIRNSQPQEWKNNPVIVAGGSAAAAILLCTALATQIVIPTQTAKLEIEVLKTKDVSRNLETELKTIQETLHSLESKNASLTAQVNELDKQLFEARLGALFSPGNPYPFGLGLIRLGAPINEVRKHFSDSQIEIDVDRPELLKVNLENSPFIWAMYTFDKKDPEQKIDRISFILDYRKDFADDFLHKKIIEAIGSPNENPKRGYYKWHHFVGASIYLINDSYIIMNPLFVPITWPE